MDARGGSGSGGWLLPDSAWVVGLSIMQKLQPLHNRWFIIAGPTAAGGAAAGAGTWAGAGEVAVAGAAAGSGCCSTSVVAWFRQKLFKLFNYAANRKLCGNFVATVGPDGKDEEPTATATSTSAAVAAVENCCLARLTN